eukprot:364676_1
MASKRSSKDANINSGKQELKHKKQRLNESEEASNNTNSSSENEKDPAKQFIDSLKVINYSKGKLCYLTDQKYSNQIEERKNALLKIKPAEPLTSDDYNQNGELINKNKKWSHILTLEILKNIFECCVSDKEILDLIKTCKSWRDIVINIDEETSPLFQKLWGPIVCNKINRKHKFCWKDLALIPKKYLALIGQIPSSYIEEFTLKENEVYRKLIANGRGEEYDNEEIISKDCNMPLIIQTILNCPNLVSIELSGRLCHDIFVVLANFAKNLDHISLDFCEGIDIMHWFGILGEAHVDKNAIPKFKSIHVDRGWIQFDIGKFSSYFKQLEEVNLQKKYVDGNSLCLLFENCKQLISVTIWRCVSADGDWYNAFKSLTKNKVIQYINIDSAEGFDDDCCKLFLGKRICPKLTVLHLHYVSCSQKWIKKLKKQRANIDFYLCTF